MSKDYKKLVRLYMLFDILSDTERTGPILWHIERKRLEDVKDHICDLIIMLRIMKTELPFYLNYDKMIDYILCHDLPEAITGDITQFEGVSKEERDRVTKIAEDYLRDFFGDVIDFGTIFEEYHNRDNLEAKVVHMLDRVHSAIAFIKYQSERNVDMDDPRIIPVLRNHPFVVQKIAEGRDLADIFYEFHMQALNFTAQECRKYLISPSDAKEIVDVIREFAEEMYREKRYGTLLDVKKDLPVAAMKYRREFKPYDA